MNRRTQSEYIRFDKKSDLIKRWTAIILLKADLQSHLMFSRIDAAILRGFDISALDKENQMDADFMTQWLAAQLKRCAKSSFNEADVFSINTAQLGRSIGLNETELAILRFACLANCYRPLDQCVEICGNMFSEVDLCDLLSELLCKSFDSVFEAMHPSGLLRKSGLVMASRNSTSVQRITDWLTIPGVLVRQIFRGQEKGDILLDAFYHRGPKSTLTMRDLGHLRAELLLVKKYLEASFTEGAVGANVLFWGSPGTGKTEMARYLAQTLRKKPLEINTVDPDGHALKSSDRFDCFRFCQGVMREGCGSLVVFDEVEDVLSDDTFARLGFKGNGSFSKGLVNKVLESNTAPSIWITNTVDGIDPAYLRRFDIVQQLKTPLAHVKKRMAKRVFKDLPMGDDFVNRIVENKSITPAHLQKVTRVCTRLGVKTNGEASKVVSQILNGDLAALRAKPIRDKKKSSKKAALPYKQSLINCDTDIKQVAKHLRADSSARMCLFGPPGTGKTAWARHVARQVKRPLLIKQGADIFNEYVGGTEKRIRDAFLEATKTKSILLFDEVDSFLPNRESVTQHWQVSETNQFLTAIEEFDGVLLCTTNLIDNLDPATMRRFDFKISFDYLKPEQAIEMAMDFCKVFKVPVTKQGRVMLEVKLGRLKLAQGDFAALLRRYSVMNEKPKVQKLCEELKKEAGFREEKSRPIGFLSSM